MKIFLDTANIAEIQKAASWGIIDGVTTNPTLIARENKNFQTIIDNISELIQGPISVEVIGNTADQMIQEAEKYASWSNNIVVKIPMTFEGLKAVHHLHRKKISTNMTLVFSANQAILSAKAGATYISPFIGRLDDMGNNGIEVVKHFMRIKNNYNMKSEIIVASIRHPLHVLDAAIIGADIVTVPFNVIEKMVMHPLTDIGMENFLKDWKIVEQKNNI